MSSAPRQRTPLLVLSHTIRLHGGLGGGGVSSGWRERGQEYSGNGGVRELGPGGDGSEHPRWWTMTPPVLTFYGHRMDVFWKALFIAS